MPYMIDRWSTILQTNRSLCNKPLVWFISITFLNSVS
nr:MAG: hypothetical protein [Apis mellifera filamentous virus]